MNVTKMKVCDGTGKYKIQGIEPATIFLALVGLCLLLEFLIKKWRDFRRIEINNSKYVLVTSSEDTIGRKLVQTLDEKGFRSVPFSLL